MLIADTHLGTLADEDVAARIEASETLRVVLDDTQRQRSRVRTTTTDGRDLGITVGRELSDEDVLVARDSDADDAEERFIVVELEGVPAVELSFENVTSDALARAVGLGHAVGNRHRDLATADEGVIIRAETDRDRLDALLDANLPSGTTREYTTVPPATFDSGSGRAHATPDHSHGMAEHSRGSSDHTHSHTHTHSHEHTHERTEEDHS